MNSHFVTFTNNIFMFLVESRPSIRRMEADLITGELSRTKLKPKMTRPAFLPKI